MSGFINSSVLRLLDASANRAREALRVLEDHARFARDDASLSEELKVLRHDLTAAIAPFLTEAIAHRDTAGDVGTLIATPAEAERAGLAEVVIAAGKRLGEALRSIEEYLKTIDPAAAGVVEQIRYRFYVAEQLVVLSLPRPAGLAMAGVRLYVLITEAQCKIPWLDAARQAIEGGADCLQLREKDLEGAELLRRAKAFVSLCREHGVVSIINDRPDIVALADADGVHVGQGDLPVPAVRQLLGREKIIGVSTHDIDQARQAVTDRADYIGVGPVFPSGTKPRDFLPGLDYARQVAAEIDLPAIAIAGITPENVQDVLATGLKAVAVTAAVVGQPDVRAAARRMKELLPVAPARAFLPANGEHPSLVGRTFLSVSPSVGQASVPVSPPSPFTSRRKLPHLDVGQATYFVTFRVLKGQLSEPERDLVFNHLRSGDRKYYHLLAAVVMPDHAHMLFQPRDGYTLSQICKGSKGVSARLVNQSRRDRGQLWQDESFDRVMRNGDEVIEKMNYVYLNPVKRGLVKEPLDYRWTYILED